MLCMLSFFEDKSAQSVIGQLVTICFYGVFLMDQEGSIFRCEGMTALFRDAAEQSIRANKILSVPNETIPQPTWNAWVPSLDFYK